MLIECSHENKMVPPVFVCNHIIEGASIAEAEEFGVEGTDDLYPFFNCKACVGKIVALGTHKMICEPCFMRGQGQAV